MFMNYDALLNTPCSQVASRMLENGWRVFLLFNSLSHAHLAAAPTALLYFEKRTLKGRLGGYHHFTLSR
jgi:hypothetical protein